MKANQNSSRNISGKRFRHSSLILIGLSVTIAVVVLFSILLPKTSPEETLEEYLSGLCSAPDPSLCVSESGKLLEKIWYDSLSFEIAESQKTGIRSAEINVNISYADINALTSEVSNELSIFLSAAVDSADSLDDVYTAELEFLPEVIDSAYYKALNSLSETYSHYVNRAELSARLRYSNKKWEIINADELDTIISYVNFDETFSALAESAVKQIGYIPKPYSLPLDSSPGPLPDLSLFGETFEPAEISTLLDSTAARALIGEQSICWNEDIPFLSGSPIRYYLDESILAIVWQQVEAETVGTYAEVIISDASQLRRKLCDDSFGSMNYYYATELSKQSNAVLALSGDFYNYNPYERVLGVYVYDGKVCRANLNSGETCYFDSDGNMIFSYAGQFSDNDEAQRFVDENGIRFSLSFGPVLIENGVVRLPEEYPIGEINDYYARYAIGQLGERHYLALTMNCSEEHFYLATLRQACDAMLRCGCVNAYTLDGGQTGSIIINNRLINPVQFGFERVMSDIFYFSSGIQ